MIESLRRFVKNKYFIGGAILLVIVALIILVRSGGDSGIESAEAKIGNIVEEVSVTGKVLPTEKADLAFEKSGTVSFIAKKVGDIVTRGELIISLDNRSSLASLGAAQADYADKARGLRPEELAVEKDKVTTAELALKNSRIDALDASEESFVKSQAALVSYADLYFDNPQSVNPRINIRTPSLVSETSINTKRLKAGEALDSWSSANSASNPTPENLLQSAQKYLSVVRDFMNNLSSIANDLNPGNSGLSQTSIDTIVENINSGLTNLNTAASTITSAKTSLDGAVSNYNQVLSQYNLEVAGNSPDSISASLAKVNQAAAEVARGQIFAPFAGLVTKIEPSLGEFVSAGEIVSGVISDEAFKIEAYVAEADIAKVSVGDKAPVTLDAYGPDVVFQAVVYMIDPAETVLEGVPTYKVTLQFMDKDQRIRSGMTANIDITTDERSGVIVIPFRSVIDEDGEKIVRILKRGGKSYETRPVVAGLRGSDGMVEIISGLNEGDKVVTYIK